MNEEAVHLFVDEIKEVVWYEVEVERVERRDGKNERGREEKERVREFAEV
jgi:hypothetical protein